MATTICCDHCLLFCAALCDLSVATASLRLPESASFEPHQQQVNTFLHADTFGFIHPGETASAHFSLLVAPDLAKNWSHRQQGVLSYSLWALYTSISNILSECYWWDFFCDTSKTIHTHGAHPQHLLPLCTNKMTYFSQ